MSFCQATRALPSATRTTRIHLAFGCPSSSSSTPSGTSASAEDQTCLPVARSLRVTFEGS